MNIINVLEFAERMGEFEGEEYIEIPRDLLRQHPLPDSTPWKEVGTTQREGDWFVREFFPGVVDTVILKQEKSSGSAIQDG